MILPWVDYAKGSVLIKPEEFVSTILGVVKMRGDFSYAQLLSLCNKDQNMLALDAHMAKRFATAVNRNSLWPWSAESRDCDDQEAMFRADRIKGRWRAGLRSPEAFGGIKYNSRSRAGWHLASCAVVTHKNTLMALIYQPDEDKWHGSDEVVECEYFDA